MVENAQILKVLVAAPSDVQGERRTVGAAIQDVNNLLRSTGIRFEMLSWDRHVRPGLGRDAQSVINEQIGDDYTVLVGIMWTRFGSPTGRADSGTEEEFTRVLERHENGERVDAMFYFKTALVDVRGIDPEQLGRVRDFRARVQAAGLVSEFSDDESFRQALTQHLHSFAQSWRARVPEGKQHEDARVVGNSSLENLAALEAEADEPGVLDLFEDASNAMMSTREITRRITEATEAVGEQFARRKKELDTVKSSDDLRERKRIVNNSASDLEAFVGRLAVEIPQLRDQQAAAMGNVETAVLQVGPALASVDGGASLAEMRKSIREYREAMEGAIDPVSGFRNSTADMPRMTKEFNRAKRRGAAVLDDLLAQIYRAVEQAKQVETVLEGLKDATVPR